MSRDGDTGISSRSNGSLSWRAQGDKPKPPPSAQRKKKGKGPKIADGIKPGKMAIFGAKKINGKEDVEGEGEVSKGEVQAVVKKKIAPQGTNAASQQPGPIKIARKAPAAADAVSSQKQKAHPQAIRVNTSQTEKKVQIAAPQPSRSSAQTTTRNRALKCFKVVDEISRWCCSKESLPDFIRQDNQSYRVVGVLGEQGSGRSWVLNQLGATFEVQSEAHRRSSRHQTEGVDFCFGSIGGERVLFVDTYPLFSASVFSESVKHHNPLSEHRDSHAVLSGVLDLQLCVFLLSICDVILVVEDHALVGNRHLWNTLRLSYLAKSGDALGHDVADIVLVRNRVPSPVLDSVTALKVLQGEWSSYFEDLIPHAALHPKLGFAALGAYADSEVASTSPEITYLKRVLLFDCFPNPETIQQEDPFKAAEFAFVDEDDETDNVLGELGPGSHSAPRFSHFHALHNELSAKEAKQRKVSLKGEVAPPAVQHGLRSNRLPESEFIDACSRMWSKEILESVQMRELMATIRAQDVFFV